METPNYTIAFTMKYSINKINYSVNYLSPQEQAVIQFYPMLQSLDHAEEHRVA